MTVGGLEKKFLHKENHFPKRLPLIGLRSLMFNRPIFIRGTQRQFLENICSEDGLRSRNFRNICCKISCFPASPRIFEHLKNGIIAHF